MTPGAILFVFRAILFVFRVTGFAPPEQPTLECLSRNARSIIWPKIRDFLGVF